MEYQANTSFPFYAPYAAIPVYSTTLILQVVGIIVNVLFIYVAPRGKSKQSNETLIILCAVQIAQAVVTFGWSTFCFICQGRRQTSHLLNVFHSLELLIKGMYIWFAVLLNASRFLVIKNIKKPQNNTTRMQRSFPRLFPFPVVVAISFVYGTAPFFKIQVVTINIIRYSCKIIGEGLPFMVFLIFSMAIFVSLSGLIYSRNNQILAVQDGNPGTSNQRERVTCKLQRQIVHSSLFQVGFMVLPYCYIVCMDMIPIRWVKYKDILENCDTFYCLIQAMLPLLNPLSLGILLKEQRKNLELFLRANRISNFIISSFNFNQHRNEQLETIHESDVLQTDKEKDDINVHENTTESDVIRKKTSTLIHCQSKSISLSEDSVSFGSCVNPSDELVNMKNVSVVCGENVGFFDPTVKIRAPSSVDDSPIMISGQSVIEIESDKARESLNGISTPKTWKHSNLRRLTAESLKTQDLDRYMIPKTRGSFESFTSFRSRLATNEMERKSKNSKTSIDSYKRHVSVNEKTETYINASSRSTDSVRTRTSSQFVQLSVPCIDNQSLESLESAIQETVMYF